MQQHVLAIDQECRWALIEWRETGLSSFCSWGLGLAELDFLSGECRCGEWHTQANFWRLWSSLRHEMGLTALLTCLFPSNIWKGTSATLHFCHSLDCFLQPLGVWVQNTVFSEDQPDLPKPPNKRLLFWASNYKYIHDSVIFAP